MPSMGDGECAARLEADHAGRGDDLGQHAGPYGLVTHDAMLADLLAAGLELRLDQRDDIGAGPQERRHDRGECTAAR